MSRFPLNFKTDRRLTCVLVSAGWQYRGVDWTTTETDLFDPTNDCFRATRMFGYLLCMPVSPSFVVKVISGDPVRDDRFLRVADIKQPVANQIAQHRFQPILGFSIPFQFDVAAWLWPEVGHVIAAAKADGHKVVDFIIGVRSRWQSVASENFITQRIAEVAMFAGVTADLYRRVVLD